MRAHSMTTNAMVGAVAFVVVVRLLLEGTVHLLAAPINALSERLPDTDGPSFPRLARFKAWLVSRASGRMPSWVEYNGNLTFLLKTTAGSGRIDELVNRIPDTAIRAWLKFGIASVVVFLVGWGILLLAGLALAMRTAVDLLAALGNWAMAFDWTSLFNQQQDTPFDFVEALIQTVTSLPEIAHALAALTLALTVALAVTTVFFWLVMLAFLPGLTLHELGHYAAMRKAGGSVESYGLLLIGPVPGGAFVEPGDDIEDLPTESLFGVWAAGIANTLIWGTTLVVAGLLLAGNPGSVLHALYGQEYGIFATHPLSSMLLALGMVEVANGFLNAVPLGPVDGGGFIRTAEENWWGIDDSDRFGDRIRHVLANAFADG